MDSCLRFLHEYDSSMKTLTKSSLQILHMVFGFSLGARVLRIYTICTELFEGFFLSIAWFRIWLQYFEKQYLEMIWEKG